MICKKSDKGYHCFGFGMVERIRVCKLGRFKRMRCYDVDGDIIEFNNYIYAYIDGNKLYVVIQ